MTVLAATLVLSLCQTPLPQGGVEVPRPSAKTTSKTPSKPVPKPLQEIHLVGGESIRGTVLKQRGNYIEVRMAQGTVIGFERSRVVSITELAEGAAKPASRAKLAVRNDWYLLHDGEGKSAGYLHCLVQQQPTGGIRVSEEWFFTAQKGRTQITILEDSDADLTPRSSFYHERVINAKERVSSERLVNADIRGQKLVVQSRSLLGNKRQSYSFSQSTRFPLTYREQLRQTKDATVVAGKQALYDSRTGEFRTWNASCRRREVEVRGRRTQVQELKFDEGRATNTEWIDSSHRVVRREVNGVALVAIPTTKARALRAVVSRGDVGVDPAFVASSTGNLAMWLPNPTWRVHRQDESGIHIEAPLYEGQAVLMEFDQIPAETHLESAADHVVRWLRLTLGKTLEIRTRTAKRVQRSNGIELGISWSTSKRGQSRPWKGRAYVFRTGDRLVACWCAAPTARFGDVEGDFARILATVQLDPKDVAPKLQGPLAVKKPR